MKKYSFILLTAILLFSQMAFSQLVTKTTTENFDDATSISLTSTPSNGWKVNTNYNVSPPNSYRASVPNMPGDSVVLQTQSYDLSGMEYVMMRFKHICKVSPQDIVRIEYRTSMGWNPIPDWTYTGKSTSYATNDPFNGYSYAEWQGNDNLALPNSSWWKEETFDISAIVSQEPNVEFRFILKHGSVFGTQASYGWLMDDFEIIAANYTLIAPIVEFVPPLLRDTVYGVGPHIVNAKVKTSTTARIEVPSLIYTATYNGAHVKTETIVMDNISGDSLWRASIPQYVEGTTITYSITGKDTTNNEATVTSSYYIKTTTTGMILGYAYYAAADTTAGTGVNSASVYSATDGNSASRTVYWNSELLGDIDHTQPIVISSMAWYNRSYDYKFERTSLKIYLQATTATTNTAVYIDPVANGATLVYDGPTTTQLFWNEVTLVEAFELPAGSNLMVYFEENSGFTNSGGYVYWAGRTVSNRTVYGTNSMSFSTTCPIMRFGIGMLTRDNNSISLSSIDSPISETIIGGASNPIIVSIQNQGSSDLDSAIIYWQVNNGNVDSVKWRGKLPTDFTEQVILGNYNAVLNGYDVVSVWVSYPNGVLDSFTKDDTLQSTVYGCSQRLLGSYTVGAGGYFSSIEDAMQIILDCGVNGNVSLELLNGNYAQNMNFTNFGMSLGQYTLTITSHAGHSDSVIFDISSGVGVTLNNSSNLIFKDITINASSATSATYGVQFKGACDNITIRDCKILTSPTATGNTVVPIHKADGTGVASNISIINNLLNGGYYGFYFYGGTSSTVLGRNIIFDSNTVSNQYYYSVYIYNTNFTSFSHNQMLSRETNSSSSWSASYMYYSRGHIVGNRVVQRSNSIESPIGFYFNNYNHRVDKILFANNEIILNSPTASSNPRGIVILNSWLNIIHNSISVRGYRFGSGRGVDITNSSENYLQIKNNNIALTPLTGYPIYFNTTGNLQYYNLNNNNMYAPDFVGYYGRAIATIAEWQGIFTTDLTSRKELPIFDNSYENLKIKNYALFLSDSLLPNDKEGKAREFLTTLGCYDDLLDCNANVALVKIEGLRGGSISGQTDSLKVIIVNTGTTPISNINIEWAINGTSQIVGGKNYTTYLFQGMSDTLLLGGTVYFSGEMEVKAWINNLENGTLTDSFREDDTSSVSSFICVDSLSGVISIGTTEYPSINEALEKIFICGASGDITFEIATGTYEEDLNLRDIADVLGDYSFTITSATGNADDVIIRPAAEVGITLHNSNNIIIKDITIDVINRTYGIQFTGACTNVLVRDCKILSTNTTTGSASPIYKANGTGIANNISFINNLLDGGYQGFCFYAGTGSTALGKNIIFDSNMVINQYYYGLYPYYTDFISCSYNTILSRESNTGATWRAIYASYCNGHITNNRITQRSNNITTPNGIYLSYHNYYQTQERGRIANNEIILYSTSTYSGIQTLNYTRVEIVHNSIYMTGTAAVRGIIISNNANNNMIIKNNNIVLAPNTAHPIYFSGTGNQSLYDIDHNNMYAPQYVGYYGANIATIDAWQQLFQSDKNSTRILPTFIDLTTGLKLADYAGLRCDTLSSVPTDILGIPRLIPTTIGCYQGDLADVNGALEEISGLQEGMVNGETDTIKLAFRNMGFTTLSSVKIGWALNGSIQTSKNISFSTPLQQMKSEIIALEEITYTPGTLNITAWIENLNGSLIDEVTNNDTINISKYICQDTLSGIIPIGASQTYKTISEAMFAASFCGVNGDITFVLDNGLYAENVNLANTNDFMNGYSLTITSAAVDADAAIIRSGSGAAVILGNSDNISLNNITIDATSGTYGIQFTEACSNVEVRDCKILANLTATGAGYAPIYKGASTGIVDNLSFTKNILDGGYHGFYFDAGLTNIYGTNILFDSNVVSNQYYYGVYSSHADFTSYSYNTILSKESNAGVNWRAMYISNSNGPITNNRIAQRSNSITSPYGIYTSYYNYSFTQDRGFIVNNEITLNATGTNSGGIFSDYSNSEVLHNSIYIAGTGAARGIDIDNSSPFNTMLIANNSIVMISPIAYPIYFGTTGNLNFYDFNSNNMYASAYVGYYNGNIVTMANWKQQVAMTDNRSVSTLPNFIDVTSSLKKANYLGFQCTAYPSVQMDIANTDRNVLTTMGCYHGSVTMATNVSLIEVIGKSTGLVQGEKDSLYVLVYNSGSTTLDSIHLEWSFNSTIQWAKNIVFTTPLLTGQSEILFLGSITYPIGVSNTKVWVNNLNGGLLTDENRLDDTITKSVSACLNSLTGEITIGPNGTYSSIKDALDMGLSCGVTGDVTFLLESGIYQENWNFTGLSTIMRGYTLTITSATGNADNVILRPAGAVGIIMNKTDNIIIKDITIDMVSGTYGIQFTSSCTNVMVRDCKILANPLAGTANYAPIYKGNNTGVVDNISFINNLLDGGFYGIYFSGGTGTTAYGTNVVFDSNTVSNNFQYGVIMNNLNLTSCSYNSLFSRTSSAFSFWCGMELNYCNGPIIGNRMLQRTSVIVASYGLNMSYHNYYNTQDMGLIANNEIIIYPIGFAGMQISYPRSEIINNSIYTGSFAYTRGISIENLGNNPITIKNNLLIFNNHMGHGIYFAEAGNLHLCDVDYNLFYSNANSYIGYHGGNLQTLAQWQQQIPSDNNSVNFLPNFVNIDNSLELSDYQGLIIPRISSVTKNIKGEERFLSTTVGAYGVGLNNKADMEISSILIESTETGSFCLGDYVPVVIKVANIGDHVFDFSSNPLTINLNVTGPEDFIPLDTNITINNGTLGLFESNTFKITDSLDIYNPGLYEIVVSISHVEDTVTNNNSISSSYVNARIALPMIEDFSNGLNLDKFEYSGNTTYQWVAVSQGLGRDIALMPDSGTQMLAFGGTRGAMTHLSTRQLQLSRTRVPKLEFWYFHDILESEDYTDVRITVDGGGTYTSLLSLTKQGATYGWHYYEVDLTPYNSGSGCVSILFESMVRSMNINDSYQYIDMIKITSQPNLELSEILLSELSVCALGTNQLRIKRTTTANQIIDFTQYSTDIKVEITGPTNHSFTYPLQDILAGDTSDIITITNNIPFVPGTYTITAYLTNPVDDYHMDDTIRTTIVINPALSVRIETLSDCINSFVIGKQSVESKVILTNIGNIDLSDINLILDVHSDSYSFQTTGSFTDVLASGDTKTYIFTDEFIVPMDAEYHLNVTAYLSCDSALVNADTSETECVDINDLYIVNIDHPTGTDIDNVGSVIKPIVSIGNHCMNDFDNIEVTALIVGSDGIEKGRIEETINRINMEDTLKYEFTGSYTVPAIKNYNLIIYFKSVDSYLSNDTMSMPRTTDHVGINDINCLSISMEQNIPNPANNRTSIKYSIPQDGEVSFKIYSVNGQILYDKTENVQSGDNQIEINTSNFAAGIYFYTMEFEGQRITKRMNKQ